MKAFFLGLLHVAIGGALVPALNSIAGGNLSLKAIGVGSAIGAATQVVAYLNTAPKDQVKTLP
jgi:hypothetical protein